MSALSPVQLGRLNLRIRTLHGHSANWRELRSLEVTEKYGAPKGTILELFFRTSCRSCHMLVGPVDLETQVRLCIFPCVGTCQVKLLPSGPWHHNLVVRAKGTPHNAEDRRELGVHQKNNTARGS